MTEIWWCRVYDRPELEADCSFKGVPLQGHKACGLVRLVPVDALVIVRDADGNWPIPVIAALSAATVRGMRRDTLRSQAFSDALDALAETAKANPQ